MRNDPQTVQGSPQDSISRIPDPALTHLSALGAVVNGVQVRSLGRSDLEQLMARLGKDSLEGLDLSGADMRGIDIRGMNLSNLVMRYCNLEGAIGMPLLTDENGVRLPATDPGYELALNGWYTGDVPKWVASVEATVLDGVDMNLSILSRSDLRGAIMRGATFTRGEMVSADLSYVDLSDANLQWVKMDGAVFRLARLRGADLERSRMLDVDLTHTDLQDASLSGISFSQGTRFEMARWDRDYISVLERNGRFQEAITLYRELMAWHEVARLKDAAGRFYYRMKESQRKAKLQSLGEHFRELRNEAGKVLGPFGHR